MWLEFLRVGLGALRAHKFRATLTVLSVTMGAFSIVLMASLARSGIDTLTKGIEDTGGSRFVAFFGKTPEGGEKKRASYPRGLVPSDAAAMEGRVPHVRHFASDANFGHLDVLTDGKTKGADVMGGNVAFLDAYNIQLAAGRPIDDDDIAGSRRVAVLGHEVAAVLFASPADALGKVVRVGTDSYRVIGVAAKVRRFMFRLWFDWNEFVQVPITAGPGGNDDEHNRGSRIILVTEGKAFNKTVEQVASAVLLGRHRGVDDFESFDFSVEIDRFYSVFRIMQTIVAFIAGIALLVGGIGVMNILLVSVSERVREIGIRKALGAPDRAIGAQFLFESALLSGLGGAVGVSLGVVAALGVGAWLKTREEAWVSTLAPEAIIAALALSVLIGVVFGVVPARRAGKLQVIDCLRAAG